MERRVRLGDVIDDYCTRCRRLMNHGIVGMVGDDVAKVRCNTCQSEHAYKHGRLPKRRRGETDRLFAEVLRGITGTDPEAEEPAAEEAEGAGPDDEREAPPAATRAAARGAAGEEEDGDAGDADTPTESDEAPPEPADAPPPADEDHPAHGVRRRLFTIRRHSGGKAPVEGVSTDIGRPGGPVTGNRPGGQGGGRGGRPQHGPQGGQGGHGGRWPKRRGRRR
jgi:hypothetical protein